MRKEGTRTMHARERERERGRVARRRKGGRANEGGEGAVQSAHPPASSENLSHTALIPVLTTLSRSERLRTRAAETVTLPQSHSGALDAGRIRVHATVRGSMLASAWTSMRSCLRVESSLRRLLFPLVAPFRPVEMRRRQAKLELRGEFRTRRSVGPFTGGDRTMHGGRKGTHGRERPTGVCARREGAPPPSRLTVRRRCGPHAAPTGAEHGAL
jgi:hypothetical protein